MKKKIKKKKKKRQVAATLEVTLVSTEHMTLPQKFLIEVVEIKGGK